MAPARRLTNLLASTTVALAIAFLIVGCGGGASATPPASGGAAPTGSAAASPAASSALALEAPASVKAGTTFSVKWTGVPVLGDYLTIVAAGATAATPDDYVNISGAGPATLTAPTEAGSYEIWWVTGDTLDGVKARTLLAVP